MRGVFLADERDALDDRGRAGGNHCGVDGMMAVIVSVLLALLVEDADSPNSAH